MNKNIISGTRDESIYEIAQRMRENNIGAIMIMKGDLLEGIVTERDMLNKVVANAINPINSKVSRIMSTNLIVGDPEMTIVKIATIMKLNHIKKLPIVENGKLVGIITQTDLLKILSYK
jgi:CBS domain-containing protein